MFVLNMSWANQVGYSQGEDVYLFMDRPSAVAKIREQVIDCGLWHDGTDWGDQDPDFVSHETRQPVNDGWLRVDGEGNVSYRIVEVDLSRSHVCDSDGREETHTLCSVCGMCDHGI